MNSIEPPPRVVTSGPPAGSVLVRGHGWRVTLPVALLVSIATALATRLASDERRLLEQESQIQLLQERLQACHGKTQDKQ